MQCVSTVSGRIETVKIVSQILMIWGSSGLLPTTDMQECAEVLTTDMQEGTKILTADL